MIRPVIRMNIPRQPTLFPAEGQYVLWGRESPRHKWRAIGSADTAAEAWGLMDTAGIRGGDWILIADGSDPNHPKEKP